ncbi:MAG: nucleoside deaminase [Candidatus Dojkabacteria bacterium]|jgi:guanine deaminase|nr:nucleoside deaminase [Candidatus Dojkabacteria bacterium]
MNTYMQVALDEARKGMKKGHGGPFGAVIVKDGKILAKAHNSVLKDHDATCHAEMNVIRMVSKKYKDFDLSSCEIYTTGMPCKMCEAAINWAKIRKVYYGNTYKDALNMGFNEQKGNNDKLEMVRIDSFETVKLVEEWNSLSKKRLY